MKAARLATDGVGKTQRARQQLQRAAEVARRRVVDAGVESIVADRHTQRRHVHAQLMLAPAQRAQPVQRPIAGARHNAQQPVKKGLGQAEARKTLRHERRIELALEGQFWDDIKRWNAGPEYYPCDVFGALGEKLETKFPNGYNIKKDNVLPIPDSEISLNNNLKQNEGY